MDASNTGSTRRITHDKPSSAFSGIDNLPSGLGYAAGANYVSTGTATTISAGTGSLTTSYNPGPRMTPEQFAYWLQGVFEMYDQPLTKREAMILDHLNQVFQKKTPNYNLPNTVNVPYTPGTLGHTYIC